MQAMGNGKATMLHAFVRELVFYIPLMFLLDRLFGEVGLAAALPVGEGLRRGLRAAFAAAYPEEERKKTDVKKASGRKSHGTCFPGSTRWGPCLTRHCHIIPTGRKWRCP